MKAVWSRIITWMEASAPQLLDVLQPGASEAQISGLESALSILLPDDFKSLYLLCNGQDYYGYDIFDGHQFLPLERIKDEWGIWKSLLDAGEFIESDGVECDRIDREIRYHWWHPKWIPFTSDRCGDHICLDLYPTERGTIGQIITMRHDDEARKVEASGIRAWLQQYADQLESGQLVFSEYYHGIVNVELLRSDIL